MALDAAQARLLVKMMRDPTALGDLWSGLGKPVSSRGGRGDELGGGEVMEGLRGAVG